VTIRRGGAWCARGRLGRRSRAALTRRELGGRIDRQREKLRRPDRVGSTGPSPADDKRFVSFTWPTLTALSAPVPDACTPWPADQLDTRLLQLTAHRRDWFAQLGFRLEPESNPEAYYFRVLVSDAQWKSLVDEALAADAFYRQRDAS
jgi:hypothetical protein